MSNAVFELAILLSLKDAASHGLDSFGEKLRARGKDAHQTLEEFESLRKQIGKNIAIGGIGLATLKMLKDGAEQAGDFQSSLTELRLAIEQVGKDGSLDLAKLNDQMERFSKLGVELGNVLPGNTQDFIDMFIALKQGGLQAETILGGAGTAVAHLAVLTGSNPAELAKQYAQVGEQFSLKPEEYAPSSEIFLKLFRAKGLRPEDLIEGTKFAQLRGGLPLGMRGLAGMETMTTMLGILKASGLEGGMGGREMAGLLMHLAATSKEQRKADDALRAKGIDLQFFNKQGEFSGTENAIQQFAKLKKLSSEEKMDLVKKRFGSAEAMGPVSILSEQGLEGYEKLKAQMAAVPPMQDQINEKTANFNQQMEALSGTLDNLKVTVFTPLLAPLSDAAGKANTLVGNLQEFAEANPTIIKTGLFIAGIGAATATAYAGINLLTTSWKWLKIALAIGRNEEGIIQFLTQLKTQTTATTTAVQVAVAETQAAAGATQMQLPWADNMLGTGSAQGQLPFMYQTQAATRATAVEIKSATAKAGLFRRTMTNLPSRVTTTVSLAGEKAREGLTRIKGGLDSLAASPAVALTVTMLTVGFTIDKFLEFKQEYDDFQQQNRESQATAKQTYDEATLTTLRAGGRMSPEMIHQQAESAWQSMLGGGELEQALDPSKRKFWTRWVVGDFNPYGSKANRNFSDPYHYFDPKTAGEIWRKSLVQFSDPRVLAELIRKVNQSDMPVEQRERVKQALASGAGQDKYREAQAIANQQVAESLKAVGQGADALLTGIKELPPAFRRLDVSVSTLASRFSHVEPTVPSFSVDNQPPRFQFDAGAQPQTFNQPSFRFPSKASGGMVERGGFVHVHDREAIVPARVTARWRDDEGAPATVSRAKRAVHITFNAPLVSVAAGSRAADDPAALAELVRDRLLHEMEIAEERA